MKTIVSCHNDNGLDNKLGHESVSKILQALPTNTSLQELDLSRWYDTNTAFDALITESIHRQLPWEPWGRDLGKSTPQCSPQNTYYLWYVNTPFFVIHS